MAEQRPETAVTILGRGRVGASLAGALRAAGIDVSLRAARDDASFADGFAAGAIVVLAVPDGAIEATAERVAAAADGESCDGDLRGAAASTSVQDQMRPAVVHLSGASGFEPLRALREAGFPVGIAHPFAPFPEAREPAFFRGVTLGVAASDTALLGRLEVLASAIGAVSQRVDADGWVAYHAAAVMASNYLVVLAAQASALLEQAGFDAEGARDALVPLMRGTLDNLAVEGVANALSGPLRRGDAGTVERHLDRLDATAPEIAATYRALARPGIGLAVGTGLDTANAERLRRVVD